MLCRLSELGAVCAAFVIVACAEHGAQDHEGLVVMSAGQGGQAGGGASGPAAGSSSAGLSTGGLTTGGAAGCSGGFACAGGRAGDGGSNVGGGGTAGGGSAGAPDQHPPSPFDGSGDLRDGYLRFAGRWDRSDAGVARSYWGGAYVRARFTGTQVKVDVDGGATFVVDGAVLQSPPRSGSVYDLSAQLTTGGTHELLVVAANQNIELAFRGLTLGSDTVTLTPAPRALLEFIGDSITTGGGPEFSSLLPYSWLSGEQLGDDHTQISFSGAALTSGFGFTSDKSGMDVEYFRTKNFNHLAVDNPNWDFSRYQPDVVVINLGTNDANEPAATFSASYLAFLGKVREKYPAAKLVALRPFGGAFATEIRGAVEARVMGGDAHAHFIDTEGWLQNPDDFADGTHPTPAGHLKVAARLVPLLQLEISR